MEEKNSLKDLKSFLKFVSTSLISTVLDLAIYYFSISVLKNYIPVFYTFVSTFIARIFSDSFKYYLDKYLVFHSNEKTGYFKYLLVAANKTITSAILVTLVGLSNIGHETIIKMCIDAVLFFPGFFFSKIWVHKK